MSHMQININKENRRVVLGWVIFRGLCWGLRHKKVTSGCVMRLRIVRGMRFGLFWKCFLVVFV